MILRQTNDMAYQYFYCEFHNADLSVEVFNEITGEKVTDATDHMLDLSSSGVLKLYCLITTAVGEVRTPSYTFSITTGSQVIVRDPRDQVATTSMTVTFSCDSTINGGSVVFKKSGDASHDLSSMTSTELITNGDKDDTIRNSLVIQEPTAADQGEYYCEDSNGLTSRGAYLDFMEVTISPVGRVTRYIEPLVLVCRVGFLPNAMPSWSTPEGIIQASYSYTYTDPRTQDLIFELQVDDTTGPGFYSCFGNTGQFDTSIISSESVEVIFLSVSMEGLAGYVQLNEDVIFTCTVTGQHDGVSISNGRAVLLQDAPKLSDLMTGSVKYEVKINGALTEYDSFGIAKFTCTAHFNNFKEDYSTSLELPVCGLLPIENQQAVSTVYKIKLKAKIFSSCFNLEQSEITINAIKNPLDESVIGAGSGQIDNLLIFQKDKFSPLVIADVTFIIDSFDTSDWNDKLLSFEVQISDKISDKIMTTNEFTVNVFGSVSQSETFYSLGHYNKESFTLTCVIMSPHSVPVSWLKNGKTFNLNSPSITTFEPATNLVTSLFTFLLTPETVVFTCEAVILNNKVTAAFTVVPEIYQLLPESPSSMFFDTPAVTLTTSPDKYNTRIYSSDGNLVNFPLRISETQHFISVVELGNDRGEYYQTDTIRVAGVYLTPIVDVVAGDGTVVSCRVGQTEDIIATRVEWLVGAGGSVEPSYHDIPAVDQEKDSVTVVTTATWQDNLSSGDEVTVTCRVSFNIATQGGATAVKNSEVTATMGMKCSTELTVEHGTVTAAAASIRPGESATVSCDDGFQLIGMARYSCKQGKLWDTSPVCSKSDDSDLCRPLSPTGAAVSLDEGDASKLSLECTGDEYASFRDTPKLQCKEGIGWTGDSLAGSTNVFDFQVCGKKTTPFQKSVSVTVIYSTGSEFCNSELEQQQAFTRFKEEVGLALEGVSEALDDCSSISNVGYKIKVGIPYILFCDGFISGSKNNTF